MNRYVVDVQVIVAREFIQRLGLTPAEYVELDKACFLGDYIARKISLFENKTADEIYKIAMEYVQNYDPNAPQDDIAEIMDAYNDELKHIVESEEQEEPKEEEPKKESDKSSTDKPTETGKITKIDLAQNIDSSDVPIIDKVAANLNPEKRLRVPENAGNISVQQALDILHKAPDRVLETQVLDQSKPTKVGVYKVSKEELEREEKERQARLKAKEEAKEKAAQEKAEKEKAANE